MILKINKRLLLFISLFLFPFIILTFYFIGIFYIIPNGFQNQNSVILFIGFGIVIFVFFLFFALDPKKMSREFISFKFISENFIKIVLLVLMVFSVFISPINFPLTVIAWQEVGILNYFRAIIVIIGCCFLPGSCLFNIIFPRSTLSKRLHVKPYFIKITVYPFLSLIFIGITVLILNNIGIVNRGIFFLLLFVLIIILFIFDFILQGLRNFEKLKTEFVKRKFTTCNISKNLFLIIIFSLGVSLIALGIHDSIHYLITGDSWTALAPVNSIENPNDSPILQGKIVRYPIFWCYVSYGLSVLSGIPIINANAMMAPFCFLFVFTIYLFNKAVLGNFKEKFIILSTMIVTMFSGMMFISHYDYNGAIVATNIGTVSILIFSGQFFFYYKTFALYLAFTTITLYITANKRLDGDTLVKLRKKENIKLLCITALFLIISYMTYMLPLIPVLAFVTIYSIFSKKNRINKHYLLFFFVLTLFFFFIFDVLTNSFNNFIFSYKFGDFLVWAKSSGKALDLIIDNLAYYFFFGMILIYIFIHLFLYLVRKHKYPQITKNRRKKLKNVLLNHKTLEKVVILFLGFYTIFIMLVLFNVFFKSYIFRFIYLDKNYWLYPISLLLDNIFISFGIFGIISIYFSYYCFKKNKHTFMILIFWILFSILYSSIAILIEFYEEIVFSTPPQNINYIFIKNMIFWFTRNWYFAIIPLSIFFSIGLIKSIKALNRLKLPTKFDNEIKKVIKYTFLTLLLIFSYVNVIIGGVYWGRTEGANTVSDKEAQIIGYIPYYVPNNSLILTEYRYSLFHGIETMTTCETVSAGNIFDPDNHYISYIRTINRRNIKYAALDVNEHIDLDPSVGSFLDNFLIKYYFTKMHYQYQGLGIYEYFPIDIPPFHQASLDFMIYAEGSNPREWGSKWWDVSTGDSKIQLIDEKLDHMKVLELTSSSGHAAFIKEDLHSTNGSVEFWVYTTNTSQPFIYEIYRYKKSMFQFMINDNRWEFINKTGNENKIPGLSSNPQNNTWHHVRIDFESSKQNYLDLNQFTWRVIIDGLDTSDPINYTDFYEGDWAYHHFKISNSNNSTLYIDAIGFSWDNYYNLGKNMEKSYFET